MDHAESIGQPDVATLGRKMDGWSRQAQAQKICKSVLFAQLHSLFNDFICHGSSEQVHSDTVSCILSDKIPSRTNTVCHHTFDLTRNVASISARPAAIEGAANTFLLSFRIISCVAHLKTKRSRHRWAHSFENTFHSNYDVRYGWLTSKFVRPEIQTSSRDMASKSNSWFHLIAGVPTVTQLSWDSARFNFISADDKAEPCLNIPSCHCSWGRFMLPNISNDVTE